MEREPLLLIPGPTPVPDEVVRAASRPLIPHRGAEFVELHADVTERLRQLFRTAGDVVVLPCSGTGALEAALVNTLSPGDAVLACVMGAFGDRFAQIATAYGLAVDRLEVAWGEVPAIEAITARLAGAARPYRAVLFTHSETSTGALLPLAEVAAAVRRHAPEALVLVDMISSFAGVPVELDAWGIDVAVTASQKALMTPPGLGIVAIGPRARAALEAARLPRFTWDLRPYVEKPGQPPYTPAVTLWFALQAALRRIEREGVDQVYRRHRLLAAMVRAGVRALGLEPLVADAVASPTVTAIPLPGGVAPAEVLRRLREQHGVVLAGGQGPLRGRIIRIGHMGAVQPAHIEQALAALDEVAVALGIAPAPAAAAAARAAREGGVDDGHGGSRGEETL
ncbi:MAG TPA: alanine--glyoxylate aminotransferase family protein [Bacillota bacterium]